MFMGVGADLRGDGPGAGPGRVCGEPKLRADLSQRQVKVAATAAAAAGRGRGTRAAGLGRRRPRGWALWSLVPGLRAAAPGKGLAERGAPLLRTKAEALQSAGRVWDALEMVSRVLGATCRPCEGVGPEEDRPPGTHGDRFRVLGAASHKSYPSFPGWHVQSGKPGGYGTARFPLRFLH